MLAAVMKVMMRRRGLLLQLLLRYLQKVSSTTIIQANSGFDSYYLIKALQTSSELKGDTMDDLKNVHSVRKRIILANYYEVPRKEAKHTYCICIAGNTIREH